MVTVTATDPSRPGTPPGPPPRWLPLIALLVCSGFAGLVYEVLWMRQLARLLGSTPRAAATTLTAFFLGMAAGGAMGGRLASRLRRPLLAYALLELGVALAALPLLYFADAYDASCRWLLVRVGVGLPLAAVRFMVAQLALLPACFFLGATLPVMIQHATRGGASGRTAPALYLANTLGGVLGAYAAGFHLPHMLGYQATYGLALTTTVIVAISAALVSLRQGQTQHPARVAAVPPASLGRVVAPLAFASGALVITLEVVCTRALSLVLQNSSYTYAAVLALFLLGLTLGAACAWWLARGRLALTDQVAWLLAAQATLVGITPVVLATVTDGLREVGEGQPWSRYIAAVGLTAGLVVLPIATLGGALFPLLFRDHERRSDVAAGRFAGRLLCLNAIGAACGAVVGGFVALDVLGLWGAFRGVALCYLALAAWATLASARRSSRPAAVACAVALVIVCVSPHPAPYLRPGERVVATYEGSAGQITVRRVGENLLLRIDDHYVAGDTLAAEHERRQAHLALLLHPEPKRVFFLGLGTGMTASAALEHPIDSLVVCELLPQVVEASRVHFAPALFADPRARVLVEDGRFHLGTHRGVHDLVLVDLLTPWRKGVGALFTREFYARARASLAPGGVFVHWLPLYQLSREEFLLIARTLCSAFEQVTLWRGDFLRDKPIVALVGQRGHEPFDAAGADARRAAARAAGIEDAPIGPDAEGRFTPWCAPLLAHYCGNLTGARRLLGQGPLATDDRPRLEFSSPATRRQVLAGHQEWFVAQALAEFLAALRRAVPPAEDPYLRQVPAGDRRWIRRGHAYHDRQLRLNVRLKVAPDPVR